ncbi:fer-1-like protein 5 [Dryobates pubescens]|uniref:fer-1-like protein 5 n=1 Tax=Dryobates pubescens TaxID=118200 RepID=UPI0023B91C22|nr:fer-1-like protein 5 [Dryobates pubescens]
MLRLLVAGAHIPRVSGCGHGVHVSARFRGVPRSTRVVPEEHSPTWNETLAWPLGTRPLAPTDSLTLRLRHWGQPASQGDLGAATVSLDRLVADPGLLLTLGDIPLLDPQGQPTGCTATLRCSYTPRGGAGDAAAVPLPGQMPPPAASSGSPPQPRSKAPAGSEEDFQVRVRVIEGRRLQGNDIRPVVTVLIGEHRFRTRIRAGNNPYYNEVFSQNFHLTPAQLAAQLIRIQVLHSRAIRANAIIGGSQLDVGTVYRAPGRCLSWKWLSLQHPQRPEAGTQGYLRLSLAVLRAGETLPEQEEPGKDEDVEANLLQPSPCAATLQLRIYCAEDLPQAVPGCRCLPLAVAGGGQRGFVAAAVRVTFGGRTLCTQVMPPNANPVWNEVFFFPLRLPPICDEIQLAILGGSCSSKVLATATLDLSQISSAGAELEDGPPGFLPCFGPSFLPFYGPRPDAARAAGTELGVAYRGRVLLELSTHMRPPDGRQRDSISPEDISRVQTHLPRCRFGLCGVFYSATMVPPGPELLRFELSLGNHGDSSDATCRPAASATQHGCALFDGNRYHYLPWFGDKPVVAVTSCWEDASHRWDALNLLSALCRRLERNVGELQDAPEDSKGTIGRRLLRQLAQDCGSERGGQGVGGSWVALKWRRALRQLAAQPTPTPLDAHLRASRLHLLRQVAAAAAAPPRAGWETLLPLAEGWLRRAAALAVEPQAAVPDVVLWLLRGGRRLACARVPATQVMFSPRGSAACGRLCGRVQTLFLVTLSVPPSPCPPPPTCPLSPRAQGCGGLCAQLRLQLWLGRVADSRDLARHLGGTLHVYAETYENQTKLLGKWGPRGLLGCPGFSDGVGTAGLPRHRIRPPRGWRWDGPWTVEPQWRLLLDAETNVSEVLEELYENQSRRPGGEWAPGTPGTTDSSGAEMPPKEELECPQGWHITDGWRLDMAGAVDEAEKSYHSHRRRRWLRTRRRDPAPQGPQQDVATSLQLQSRGGAAGTEGWEYGSLWGCRFHLRPRPGDVCRRRRWHRSLVPLRPSPLAPLFTLEGTEVGEQLGSTGEDPGTEEPAEDDEPAATERRPRGCSRIPPQQPLILCTFQRSNFFQLRCYIFQALELAPPGTKTTADPVAHVSFVHVSQSTRALPGTLDPLWDQTLLLQRVQLYGDPRRVRDEPPAVVVEIFDQEGGVRHLGLGGTQGWEDAPGGVTGTGVAGMEAATMRGASGFLGRSVCAPEVWLDVRRRRPPRLRRYPLWGPRGAAGELLAAFELLHDTEDGSLAEVSTPPGKDGVLSVPTDIRPLLRLVALEVLAWGLRGLPGSVRAPSLEVQCGGQTLRTPPIPDPATNPNFPINAFLLLLRLPAEEEFVPPIRLRVLDSRGFGYRPEVGQGCVRDLRQFCCQPHGQGHPRGEEQPPSPSPPAPGARTALPSLASPWARIAQMLPRITTEKAAAKVGMGVRPIYSCELEAVPEFEGLQDFCRTFPLYQPGHHPVPGEEPVPVGEFKGLFHISPMPEAPEAPPPPRRFQQLPPSRPQRCLVRVYIVRAFDLPPRDRNGLCDPYVRVSLGSTTLGQRDQYVPNTLEPVFGRLFEVTGTIPLEKDLRVSLLDYDLLPPDQEIGTTTIDLENRLLSRFRAHCGLPTRYHTTGPGCWRDQLPPSRALEHFARAQGLPVPEFNAEGTAVTFGDNTFLLSHFESAPPGHPPPGVPRERLALHLLHSCHLVPEHLETRTLYSSTQPGLEQGKVQMWVDIFPASLGPPGPPVDITPRKPQRFELRCVVWNTREVDLRDSSWGGQRMSDIYVTGWLDGLEEQRQRTDIHYRSLRGDAAFNWRLVFSFHYLPAEQLCVLPRKEHFWSLDETVLKVPPKLILQVWDNDKFSADDFLGVLELELTRLPRPAQSPRDCTPEPQGTPRSSWPWQGARAPPRLSLFRHRRARGWWPCTVQDGAQRRLSGKLELSLELLTAKEAEERPAGKGRKEPNMHPTLPEPPRPDWSFLWLQAPLRSLRYSLWQRYRCRLSLALALLLLLALLLAFVYAAPGYLAMKLVNPIPSLQLAAGEHQGQAGGKP